MRRGRGSRARDEVSLLSRSRGGRKNACGAAARIGERDDVVVRGGLGDERGAAEVAEPALPRDAHVPRVARGF